MSYVSSIELRKVRPDAVNEKGVLESVADLLHDVVEKVPQGYTASSRPINNEQLEAIEWLRFLNDAHEWHPSIRPDTLVLLIAYKSGLTLWTIEASGIASELFSIREHNICSACLLIYNHGQDDSLQITRPWIAIAKSAGPPSIQIRSLKNDQTMIKILNLPGVGIQSEPVWMESNNSILVCATHTFIIGYDLVKFNEKFFLTNSYSSIPLSLSTRWLAFADYRLHLVHQSAGGINANISDQYASYTGAVLSAAKSISKSVVKIGESVLGYSGQPANNGSIVEKSSPPKQASLSTTNSTTVNPPRHRHGSGKDESQPGIVTIIDTVKFFGTSVHDERQNWIIAHFQAHTDPIGHLQFNPSGHLLVTCDTSGHYFNVLEIQVSPYRCTRTYIKHLYTLFRGDTACRVSHMTFTTDSRWLAVSTKRGTTHLFAINPYGGAVNVRSHTKATVINKLNRYHRTNGTDEVSTRNSTTITVDNTTKESSSSLINIPNASTNSINGHGNQHGNSNRTKRSQTECIFSTAITLIRQPTESFVSGLTVPFNMDAMCLATTYGMSRGYINPEEMMNQSEQPPRACSSLFVISWHGRLIEYILEPVPATSKHGARVTSETPLALKAIPKAQWFLQRWYNWPEVRLSLAYAYLSQGNRASLTNKIRSKDDWLRQVEMNTHMGPHRRLWMGPQFQFKHYSDSIMTNEQSNAQLTNTDFQPPTTNFLESDLKSLSIYCSQSNPVHVPNNHAEIAPAYIEVGSGSFQDAPSLTVYGSSLDSLKSEIEVDLVEKLADAAADISTKTNGPVDTTESLTSSTCSSTVLRLVQTNQSLENLISFPDAGDATY